MAEGVVDLLEPVKVDEHVWHHVSEFPIEDGGRGPKQLTGMVDLTPDEYGNPRARLLDLVPGRSGNAYSDWLKERGEDFRDGVEVATLDPFHGYKNAIDDQLEDATAVLDAFHVVKLGTQAVDEVRRRVQQEIHGHRGRKNDPLYRARRTLHTGADLLIDKQKDRLTDLFAIDGHVEVEATWGIYQRMIAAYREPDRARGRALMQRLIHSLSHGVPINTFSPGFNQATDHQLSHRWCTEALLCAPSLSASNPFVLFSPCPLCAVPLAQ